jgi:hypothetical protein
MKSDALEDKLQDYIKKFCGIISAMRTFIHIRIYKKKIQIIITSFLMWQTNPHNQTSSLNLLACFVKMNPTHL